MSDDGPTVGRAAIRPSVLGRVAIGRGVAGRATTQRPVVRQPSQGRAAVKPPTAAGSPSPSSGRATVNTAPPPPAPAKKSSGRASVGKKAPAGRATVQRDRTRPPSYSPRHTGRAPLARKRRRRLSWWQEFSLLVIAALVVAVLVRSLLLQVFLIPSGSMEQTLQIQDRVIVNKVEYLFREPARGEIIVFRGADSWAPEHSAPEAQGFFARTQRLFGSLVGMTPPGEKDFIKRVIGVPGDRVECCDRQGRVLVNSKPLDEPYVFENNPLERRQFKPIVVPEGRLFVLGDHRGKSKDSRAYIEDEFSGTVAIDEVIGRAFFIAWPFSHTGTLGERTTFENSAPQPSAPYHLGAFLGVPLLLERRKWGILPQLLIRS